MPLEPEWVPIAGVYRYESVCCFDVQLGEQCMSPGPWTGPLGPPFSPRCAVVSIGRGRCPHLRCLHGSPFPPRCICCSEQRECDVLIHAAPLGLDRSDKSPHPRGMALWDHTNPVGVHQVATRGFMGELMCPSCGALARSCHGLQHIQLPVASHNYTDRTGLALCQSDFIP